MNRRTFLRHVGTTTLLVGSIGVAGAGGKQTADDLDVHFTVTGREGSDVTHRASVTCGATVEVSGRIVCETPCGSARLADVTLHHGTLRIAIESVTDEDDCEEEPTAVDYELTVSDFDHRPETVEVLHDEAFETTHECGKETGEKPHEPGLPERRKPDFSFEEREAPEFYFEEREEPEFFFEERETPEFHFEERELPEFSFGENEEYEFSMPDCSDSDC